MTIAFTDFEMRFLEKKLNTDMYLCYPFKFQAFLKYLSWQDFNQIVSIAVWRSLYVRS